MPRPNSTEAVDLVLGWRSERHRGRLSWRLRRFNYGEGSACSFNRSRRRRCSAVGRSLGWAADCCAISVARSRAALTAAMPRASRSSARLTSFGAAKSCSLLNIFMIRPPTANPQQFNDARSRPSHGHIAYSNVNQSDWRGRGWAGGMFNSLKHLHPWSRIWAGLAIHQIIQLFQCDAADGPMRHLFVSPG